MAATTIPVSIETKRELEAVKGDRTWDEVIRELLHVYRREKARKALMELRKIPLDMEYREVRLKLGLRE